MGEKIAVELRNVSKWFDEVVAVDDVSLKISDGEFFSLLGPSGCGKTTTLRMIAGFEDPTEGEIYIQGELMGLTPPFQRNTNMVFQDYALFPHMSVAKNVGFGLEMKKVPKKEIAQRVEESLELVRLPGFGDRRPDQLSGGQQQRVAVARALINRPGVLLLDEPLGSLDLKLRKEMQLELKGLQHRLGITFVYVTHDQEEALTMSDRIAVMDQGKALQVGTPTEIYERPASRFVADFIGETNFFEGKVVRRDGTSVVVEVAGMAPVLAQSAKEPSRGKSVTVAVRPEKITIDGEQPSGDSNWCQGVIRSVVYIGTDTNYVVPLASGSTMRVREQNVAPGGRKGLDEGATAFLSWQPESALLLPD
ncbi:MAG: polyamine ABC transporter ATP-binding protein [Anaerolineae bacterium]|nr:polyamine ABC transporter ATP-binding protein [Anaerolineae bacterium]NIN94766.1 polyamine ABC transporter ATP-binding protein [Anaerolineae bacterium]NIQ77848.1 polyamine ABC transporter ATP-binding protein [Anaerolineae bacterium]